MDCTNEKRRVGMYTWKMEGLDCTRANYSVGMYCTVELDSKLHMWTIPIETLEFDTTHENCIVGLYTWKL